jgi:hypothetical protein
LRHAVEHLRALSTRQPVPASAGWQRRTNRCRLVARR